MDPKPVMTINEVAEYLQLGRRSVYQLVQSGELPGRKVLGRWRFHLAEVDQWLRQTSTTSSEKRS